MINKKQCEQNNITIHWWNMGTKTTEHFNNYKEFLEDN